MHFIRPNGQNISGGKQHFLLPDAQQTAAAAKENQLAIILGMGRIKPVRAGLLPGQGRLNQLMQKFQPHSGLPRQMQGVRRGKGHKRASLPPLIIPRIRKK